MSSPAASLLCRPWAAPSDLPSALVGELENVTPDQWSMYLLQASELLYMLSGRRWLGAGACTEAAVLRQFPQGAGQGNWPYQRTWGRWGWIPAGTFMDNWLFPPMNMFTATSLQPMAIRLPRGAITAVSSVVVGGVTLDPSIWRLSPNGWLERLDNLPWSLSAQNIVVTYSFGKAPPPGGIGAACLLAGEFAKSDLGLDCKLPERVTSITRQGVSFAVLDPMTFLPLNQTGIYRVDLWLQAVNPGGRHQRARVYSPDLPTGIHSP